MGPSILAGQDRLPLNNGMELRLLSALEVLQARREAGELAQEDRERALCSNACLLARALEQAEDHTPVFADGQGGNLLHGEGGDCRPGRAMGPVPGGE